jgi:biotin-dependent carboxylase-like uncharacterized protein
MPIKVIKAGIATSIQDLGRPGYYHLGIPMGGAMDRLALRSANLLVGNDEGAACLEAVFMGPELEFTQDAMVAITGAELPPKVDGTLVETWRAFKIKAGQILSFDYLRSGARAYIAVAGGIDTKPALGSRSTYAIGALGGVNGRAIRPEDELPLGSSFRPVAEGLSLPANLRRTPGASAAGKRFFEDTWKVASEADRMGYRFQGGTPIEFVDREPPFGAGSDPSNITDACYPYGSIQVPSGAEPIVLHRDAVSGGGYFMVGTVISADMDLIGQLQPRAATRFVKVNMHTALSARRDRAALLDSVRAALI